MKNQVVRYSESNLERCGVELDEIMLDALAVIEGRPYKCAEQGSCCDCAFRPDVIHCQCNSEEGVMIKRTWLHSYIAEVTVWDKVPVNTKVLVSTNGHDWERRHFAGRIEDGKIGTFADGRTSWTREGNDDVVFWKYGILA